MAERGAKLRNLIAHSRCLGDLETEVVTSYWKKEERFGGNVDVAVRSSATTEDLPAVSFAGQQTSYLNVRGEGDLTERVMDCFASLLANRAISYRVGKGFDHLSVYLPVGVQKMVRSDLARARAMFSVDTDSGFRVRFSGTNQVILS